MWTTTWFQLRAGYGQTLGPCDAWWVVLGHRKLRWNSVWECVGWRNGSGRLGRNASNTEIVRQMTSPRVITRAIPSCHKCHLRYTTRNSSRFLEIAHVWFSLYNKMTMMTNDIMYLWPGMYPNGPRETWAQGPLRFGKYVGDTFDAQRLILGMLRELPTTHLSAAEGSGSWNFSTFSSVSITT